MSKTQQKAIRIVAVEKRLGIRFNNPQLLETALTHRSWLNEHKEPKAESNERLEFLGDAILEFWVSKLLFDRFPSYPEGILTEIRSAVVCTQSLAKIAQVLNLGRYLRLSRGEAKMGGRKNPSLLADTFEAVIGAIFLDQGWAGVEKFLNQKLAHLVIQLGKQKELKDAKTKLQELTQAKYQKLPQYRLIKRWGPAHQPRFKVAVLLAGQQLAVGVGSSKQEAEETAASRAVKKLNQIKS